MPTPRSCPGGREAGETGHKHCAGSSQAWVPAPALPFLPGYVTQANLLPPWGLGLLITDASGGSPFSLHEQPPPQMPLVITRDACPWVGRSIPGESSEVHKKAGRSRGSWLRVRLSAPGLASLVLFSPLTRLFQGEEERSQFLGTYPRSALAKHFHTPYLI